MESLDQSQLPDENQVHQGFNLNLAQFLLFLSSIMYERNEKQVIEAYHMISEMKKDIDSASDDDLQKINNLLKESEKRICDQIREFNLQFTSLSELNTLGGPYVGMFWSEENNFIIIACKGTTPTNFSEWLTNASFQRMDARDYLFGEVHQGFYSFLFPKNEYDSARLDRSCPATRIIEAVRRKGEEIRTRKMRKNHTTHENTPLVNVYVTGHSLGGALANLIYGRLIKFPQNLGEHCTLRDGTTFASPSIGDSDFAAEFSSLCNQSNEEYKTLWRIVNDSDIVPRVPPGHHHPNLRKYTQKIHIMNYFHVGDEVRFYQDGSRPSSMRDIFDDNKELMFFKHDVEWNDEWKSLFGLYDPFDRKKGQQKIKFDPKYDGKLIPIEKFLIPLIRNHMSHRYLVALEKSREFFDINKSDKAENMV
ncbi:Alpha/Beta hydrolase protein [Glomus cerebriforme]|uniref:Alpha/Beta hydrolase protein n=1 Tax=Glomus cerebriforme TaxID=658196 RepID=A0A397T8K3_9GLOM|nr:Alpha/Beta hydrolase protein [Glomus cerebriforme]